jgi:hypothetical protein
VQGHYGGGLEFRAAVKATLRRMVAAGRLEAVPGRLGLFRLGGVVRQLTEGASLGWPAGDAGPTLGDARVRAARVARLRPLLAERRLLPCATAVSRGAGASFGSRARAPALCERG